MNIKINTKTNILNYEGVFSLSLRRERKDIKNLLSLISDGKTLNDLFPNSILANNVKNFLKLKGYLNIDGNLTSEGEKFLAHPYLPETEEGLYSVDVSTTSLLDGTQISFPTQIQRILSTEEREETAVEFASLRRDNQFAFGNNESAIYYQMELKSKKAFKSEYHTQDISFDLLDKTYTLNQQTFKLSDELGEFLMNYLVDQIEVHGDGIAFDSSSLNIIVKSLKDIAEKDLLNGKLSKYEDEDIRLSDIPLRIDSVIVAREYVYFYLYHLLMENNFYSISEMNEIVHNEIIPGIMSTYVQKELYNFVVTEDGFKENLTKDQYDKLQYRLNIVKELLDIDVIQNEKLLIGFTNYNELIQMFDRRLGNDNVSCVYLVMGYAYAKNSSNDFLKCAQAFKTNYDKIVLVNKKNSSSYKADSDIENEVVKMGVITTDNPDISDSFHDRYIIFKMKDNTFKVFMCSCEIGQFFSKDTGESKGFIYEIPQSEIVKQSGSLLNMLGGKND